MKKFIIGILTLLCFGVVWNFSYFYLKIYELPAKQSQPKVFVKTSGKEILLDRGEGLEPFEVRGVDLGSGIPRHWGTDFSIDKKTYMRWFEEIKAMGANTIRVYAIQSASFYRAFYDYNVNNPDPLYLIQGVWVNDYVQNSHRDAYDAEFYKPFLESCRATVDIIHGRQLIRLGKKASSGHGSYTRDVSPWTIGYLLGMEWEDDVIAYTDAIYKGNKRYTSYQGNYLYTTKDASAFEALLTQIGDQMIGYETGKYKQQRLIAFANWMITDPFDYPQEITQYFAKCAKIDVEHIQETSDFLAGQFASYHVYPGYPDYLAYVEDWRIFGIEDQSPFLEKDGKRNTYKGYLYMLNKHHQKPLVITGFGVSSARGQARVGQKRVNERQQGEQLIKCYEDIHNSGAAGCCIVSWQDEWFQKTWNTMYAVDLLRTPYWSDIQTNGQGYGLMTFDPGETEVTCLLDGNPQEWTEEDRVQSSPDGQLYMKYDERYLYLMAKQPGIEEKTIYIPLDVTPKSGSYFCKTDELRFDRPTDFVVILNGEQGSRVLVQERYESLRSTYAHNVSGIDAYAQENIPDKDSPEFVPIELILVQKTNRARRDWAATNGGAKTYETGRLTEGCGDPASPEYDSLADYACGEGCVEIRLPWQMLNFSDPSQMLIHDDYYEGNYGIEQIAINRVYAGLATSSEGRIKLKPFRLMGWGSNITTHERLKPAYEMFKERWGMNDAGRTDDLPLSGTGTGDDRL